MILYFFCGRERRKEGEERERKCIRIVLVQILYDGNEQDCLSASVLLSVLDNNAVDYYWFSIHHNKIIYNHPLYYNQIL